MSRRIFYVVYFTSQRLQKILDAVRFIANPSEKTSAHITLRGPYSRTGNMANLSKKIAGSEAIASSIDSFIEEGQSTVFLKCDSKKFREVWNKDDFGFNPHITIYDGKSRKFAILLLERLAKIKIQFRFRVSELKPLISHKGQQAIFLRQAFDEHFVEKILGRQMTISQVEKMSFEQRIDAVEIFFRELQNVESFDLNSTFEKASTSEMIGFTELDAEEAQIELLIQ